MAEILSDHSGIQIPFIMCLCILCGIFLLHIQLQMEREPAVLREGFLLARPRSCEESFCPDSIGRTQSHGLSYMLGKQEMGRSCDLLTKGNCRFSTATYIDLIRHCPGQRSHVCGPDSACQPPLWNFSLHVIP